MSFNQQFNYIALSLYPYNISYILSSKQFIKSQTNQFSNILYLYILRLALIIIFLGLYSSNNYILSQTQLLNFAISYSSLLSLAIITLNLINYIKQSYTIRAQITRLVIYSTTKQFSTSIIYNQILSFSRVKVNSALV